MEEAAVTAQEDAERVLLDGGGDVELVVVTKIDDLGEELFQLNSLLLDVFVIHVLEQRGLGKGWEIDARVLDLQNLEKGFETTITSLDVPFFMVHTTILVVVSVDVNRVQNIAVALIFDVLKGGNHNFQLT